MNHDGFTRGWTEIPEEVKERLREAAEDVMEMRKANPTLNADTYTCSACHQTFTKTWTDAEAMQEAREMFGSIIDLEPPAVVCDDCWKKMTEETPIDFNFMDLEGFCKMMRPVFADGRYAPPLPITEAEWDAVKDCDETDLLPGIGLWRLAQARYDAAQEGKT